MFNPNPCELSPPVGRGVSFVNFDKASKDHPDLNPVPGLQLQSLPRCR